MNLYYCPSWRIIINLYCLSWGLITDDLNYQSYRYPYDADDLLREEDSKQFIELIVTSHTYSRMLHNSKEERKIFLSSNRERGVITGGSR